MQLECWLKKKRDAHFLLLSETFFFLGGGAKEEAIVRAPWIERFTFHDIEE